MIARRRALVVGRTEPYRGVRTRHGATAEAVTAVRRERPADARARRRLSRQCRRAVEPLFEHRGRVVGARRSFRRVARRDFEWVACVRPDAVVVADPRVTVEVTIFSARLMILAGDRTEERVFRVLAGADAIRIFGIDEAVAVVVHAIAASVDMTPALRDLTGRRASVERRRSIGRAVTRLSAGTRRGVLESDERVFGTRPHRDEHRREEHPPTQNARHGFPMTERTFSR